jgi:ubiquinone/menaquinone biosynthesis C-methylase UbiE
MSSPTAFTGSVPKTYHQYLGPLIFEDYAKDLARRLALKPGEGALELACGTGIVTRELAKSGARLTATDLNAAMLDVAKAQVGASPNVAFQVADACALPFADGSFDAIACQYGVMFFPDKVKAMREARRVLKPGGRYAFNVWDSLEHNPIPKAVHEALAAMYPVNPPTFLGATPYAWFDRTEIERVVRAGGFERCQIETVAFPSVAPSAEDAARGFVEGTPILGALTEKGVSDFAPVRREIAKALAAKFGDKPCRSTIRAVVVMAS